MSNLKQGENMLTLLKNLECYVPKHIGKNDIMICGDKIYKIQPHINYTDEYIYENIYDLDGMNAFPGLIDQHIHITGGGGEDGYQSRIPEIDAECIKNAGVATVVGLLGADSITRNPESLYSKAKSLEHEGITTYIYSGCYSVPPVTFTGDVVRDIVLIDKVIGIGEIAISDHRCSHNDIYTLMKLSSDAHLGGLLSGKAGIVHLHVGDGKSGLSPLFEIINKSDLPKEIFVPTHTNRNPALFTEAVQYCLGGGNIDLTAGETAGITVAAAMRRLLDAGADMSKVTISSDANGSIPGGGVSKISSLYDDIISCIREGISPETAFAAVCENVARLLRLYPKKGTLSAGSDADVLITDKEYKIKALLCNGNMLLNNI